MATRARRQYNGVYTETLCAKATIDVASLVDGAGATSTVTVPGAALGDFAKVASLITTSGIILYAWVSAEDTVSIRFQNESGGTLDLASTTFYVIVEKVDLMVFL